MSNPTTTNKQLVRRLFEEAFNEDRGELVDQLVSPNYIDGTGQRGPGAFKQVIARLRSAFPDIHYSVEEVLGEDDKVAIRWHWSGTHRGVFRGIAPTERALTNNGSAIFRVEAGQIVAAALETDRLGFLQSIGVVGPNEQLFPSPPAGAQASA
jgi:predicted ester cyclase